MQESRLRKRILDIRAKEPKIRARDLAHRLGISELALTSLGAGKRVTILEGDWKDLLANLKALGYVMALTRNEHCVHERKGIYDNIKFHGGPKNIGLAVNPDIDLRFFMNEWVYGLAIVLERGPDQLLHGLQFFNQYGEAVHKVYCTPKSDLDAYHQLVDKFKARHQEPILDIATASTRSANELPDRMIDVSGLRNSWEALQDTHDFFDMLREFKVTRPQALRLAPDSYTSKIENDAVVEMLKQVSTQEVPIMCFLHSPGCIQIHTGTVKNLSKYEQWYNIMDPEFNLHLDLSAIDQTWVVRKPTRDGMVTSLELFDSDGELIVYFFGARKPGIPELESWRGIVDNLEAVHTV